MSKNIDTKLTYPEPFLKFLNEVITPFQKLCKSGGMLAVMQASFTLDADAANDFWSAVRRGGGR
jgi:hypothetical protein